MSHKKSLAVLLYVVVKVIFMIYVKQKTAYELRICDWSSDVCSSDLRDSSQASSLPPAARQAGRLAGRDPAARGDRHQRRRQLCDLAAPQIGRASCRERECQYV